MVSDINYRELLPNGDFAVVDALSKKLETLEPKVAQKVFDELRKEIYTDSLTGLDNRKAHDRYVAKFRAELEEEDNPNMTLSYIFLDLDKFKTINDTCGHKTGDSVLSGLGKILVETMNENLRVNNRRGKEDRRGENRTNSSERRNNDRRKNKSNDVDLVARLGGEEFVVVLKNTSLKATYEIAKRLHRVIGRNLSYLGKNGKRNKVTASVGIAQYPESCPKIDDVIKYADNGMYQMKQHGRNGVAFGTGFCIED
ncbi:MAG: GGDEF domain-containing protein [Nanoarchaeota archaeon]|nr:GGDEF domain-containing protein [Nanoarchaeota archaeon]MCA9497011.1 GGDEF domain-containing protein [Nanoarchaeota archaeon]